MDATAIMHMAMISVTEHKFVMRWIVSDDDNVMRAHLRYPKRDDKKDKGKLPAWVYQPEFMADPGHRKKSIAKYSYALSTQPVSISRVTKSMTKRLKKNWGYMIQHNKVSLSEKLYDLKTQQKGNPYNYPKGLCTRSTTDGENCTNIF